MTNKFISFLQSAGSDVEKVFTDIFTPTNVSVAEGVVSTIYPAASVVFNLVANTVIVVEQKYAALGKQSGTGTQKAAEVLAIVGSTVASILSSNKITGDATAIINAVVAFLNSIGPNAVTATVTTQTPETTLTA